jgi:hypothetical protein
MARGDDPIPDTTREQVVEAIVESCASHLQHTMAPLIDHRIGWRVASRAKWFMPDSPLTAEIRRSSRRV